MTSVEVGIGARLADGRYVLTACLGQGGHGRVFKAREEGAAVRREVAIKFLQEGRCFSQLAAQQQAGLRLRAEGRLLARLPYHPHVIQVYADGVHQGHYYYVMEYLPEAQSLAHIVAAAPSPFCVRQIKHYFLPVLSGLQHVHSMPGVWHRDIKLENMIVGQGRHESVKIIDFGTVHLPDSHLTQSSQVLGTWQYLAPETLLTGEDHKPLQLDHRADLFALGIAIYKCATFAEPFATVQETLCQAVEPLAPSHHVALAAGLEKIILKLLHKDRQQRYQHAAQVSADLAALDSAAPLLAKKRPSSMPMPARLRLDLAAMHGDSPMLSATGQHHLQEALRGTPVSIKRRSATLVTMRGMVLGASLLFQDARSHALSSASASALVAPACPPPQVLHGNPGLQPVLRKPKLRAAAYAKALPHGELLARFKSRQTVKAPALAPAGTVGMLVLPFAAHTGASVEAVLPYGLRGGRGPSLPPGSHVQGRVTVANGRTAHLDFFLLRLPHHRGDRAVKATATVRMQGRTLPPHVPFAIQFGATR